MKAQQHAVGRAAAGGRRGAAAAGARESQATTPPDIIFWSTSPRRAPRQLFQVLNLPPMDLPSLSVTEHLRFNHPYRVLPL
ncbi:hypothetical protein MSG28_001557 [Choristoneura fumiferana]|uniref:Uncharacterized protein n=1 Tax=Choristoneura fumiferana TaxID=7141 RepID=A0ACC0KUD3_CHOFU|nr:hypothetical protein MSG28_001557 [Choristoneura fumiferana]